MKHNQHYALLALVLLPAPTLLRAYKVGTHALMSPRGTGNDWL